MSLSLYSIILFLSVSIGLIYIFFQLRKENTSFNKIILFFYLLAPFSFVFGKLYTVMSNYENTNFISAHFSSYGGLVGFMLSSTIFHKISADNHSYFRCSVLTFPLVYSISKIACLVAGCCYGIPYNGPFHIIHSNGLSVFPIQVLESLIFFLLFLVVHYHKKHPNIIYITLVMISILKFFLEFLRYSSIGVFLSFNQIFSVIIFIVTLIVWFYHQWTIRIDSRTDL